MDMRAGMWGLCIRPSQRLCNEPQGRLSLKYRFVAKQLYIGYWEGFIVTPVVDFCVAK